MVDLRSAIMAAASNRRGLEYRLDPPPDGMTTTDCSLLVRDSVRDAGAGDLPRTAEQIRQATIPVAWADVKPADLLFFEHTYDATGPAGPDGKIASHIGFSLGAGTRRMLDAHERDGADVAETDISSEFWQSKLIEARRLPALVGAADAGGTPDDGKPDPWEHFALAQIVSASGCPSDAVSENWPRLVEQLDHCGINDRATQIAMIGTIAIETASTFAPVREAFWLDEAWRQANLRYYPWYGRGFIQLTWEENYRAYSTKLDELWGDGAPDMGATPDAALDPDVSAAVAAMYFRDHGISAMAGRGDWTAVRKAVQGGDAGLDRLVAIAAALQGIAATPPPAPPAPTWRDSLTEEMSRHADAVREILAAAV